MAFKSKTTATILTLFGFIGIAGLQHLYLGRIWRALLWFFTLGFYGIGTLYDLFTMKSQVDKVNGFSYTSTKKKVKYIVFDTETTGLPTDYNASPTNSDAWPRMVQIAWILADKHGNEIDKQSYIIKPDGYKIPKKASDIHRITTEQALNEGLPLMRVLEKFIKSLKKADRIVGHNISFDKKVVLAEMYRLAFIRAAESMYDIDSYCTMKDTSHISRKWLKLGILYKHLFNEDFDNAHDALADVEATNRIYQEVF